jgi:hypothetical protein
MATLLIVVCSVAYVMTPSEATALAASQAFRGGCRPGQAKIPADPESGAHAFREMNNRLYSVRSFETYVSKNDPRTRRRIIPVAAQVASISFVRLLSGGIRVEQGPRD